MNDITALFWDIGGVLLSNGWDEPARAEAARALFSRTADFEQRHRRAEDEFETGKITLETYLDRTVFFRERPFDKEQFKHFIFAQSRENKETRALLDELTATRRYFLATLNNESEELNCLSHPEIRSGRETLPPFLLPAICACASPIRSSTSLRWESRNALRRNASLSTTVPRISSRRKALGMRTILFRSAEQLRAILGTQSGVRPRVGGRMIYGVHLANGHCR